MNAQKSKHKRNDKVLNQHGSLKSTDQFNQSIIQIKKDPSKTFAESTICTNYATINVTNLHPNETYNSQKCMNTSNPNTSCNATYNDAKQGEKVHSNINIENCEIDEINEIIKKNAAAKRNYSKTYAETNYVPLTTTEKKNFLQDFDKASDKRLKLYSELFKEIRSQMSYFSNNITAPVIESNMNKSKNTATAFKKTSMNNINEENDVTDISFDHQKDLKSSSRFKSKNSKIIKINNPNLDKRRSKSVFEFDWIDIDENVGIIVLPHNYYNNNTLKDLDITSTRKCYSNMASPRQGNHNIDTNYGIGFKSDAKHVDNTMPNLKMYSFY